MDARRASGPSPALLGASEVVPTSRPDWRDAENYRHLLDLDRAGWAWEWLRRNPDYDRAHRDSLESELNHQPSSQVTILRPSVLYDARKWGLSFAENPHLSAPQARILWDENHDASVLTVAASPLYSDNGNAFNLAALPAVASVVVISGNSEQAVLSDGYRRIRIDIVKGTLLAGPVRLRVEFEGFRNLDPKILTLRRLLALRTLGRLAKHLHPRERLAPRWIAALRVHDAMREAASQLEIAHSLFGPIASGSEWRDGRESLRLRVQRLGRIGRRMASGGHCMLLRQEAASAAAISCL